MNNLFNMRDSKGRRPIKLVIAGILFAISLVFLVLFIVTSSNPDVNQEQNANLQALNFYIK